MTDKHPMAMLAEQFELMERRAHERQQALLEVLATVRGNGALYR